MHGCDNYRNNLHALGGQTIFSHPYTDSNFCHDSPVVDEAVKKK